MVRDGKEVGHGAMGKMTIGEGLTVDSSDSDSLGKCLKPDFCQVNEGGGLDPFVAKPEDNR